MRSAASGGVSKPRKVTGSSQRSPLHAAGSCISENARASRNLYLHGHRRVSASRRQSDGFTVPGANRDVYDRYVAELKKENRPTDNLRFASGFWFLIVSEDPEKTFAEAANHVIYQVNNYSVWLQAGGLQPLAPHLNDQEALKQSGLLQVVDPDSAIGMIRNLADTVPITHFYSWTLPPGLPPGWAQTHLELFAAKVIPAFR